MTENTTPVYLNTAACGLISPSTLQAGVDLYKNFERNSSNTSERWRGVNGPEIRANVARFIHTGPENIALIPNFSYGMNAVVQALKGNEKVLLYRNDFPSVYLPFMINHFNIRWLDDDDGFFINPEKIESLIKSEKIDIVAISHVQWQSGFKMDLKALCSLCSRYRVQTIIDATQSLGAVSVAIPELQPDVLIASNYKWMNAGFGTGILYMSPAFAEQYPPKISGANSNAYRYADNTFTRNTSVSNYEPGSLDMFGLSVLNKAIEEKTTRGIVAVEAHNKTLTAMLLHQLQSLPVQLTGNAGVENRSSIVVIKEEKGLHEYLLNNNIITTCRNGIIRISIHFYNTGEEINTFADCVRSWAQNRP